MKYNFKTIEKKWRETWKKSKIYEPKLGNPKKKLYHLVMFPYPSGDLHIGHWYNFVPSDAYARMKRMQGYDVLSPFGYDAFGLPAENAAIKRGIHPKIWTMKNIKTMTKQVEATGNSYAWNQMVITCLPEYYKWNQWIFLQLYKKGLAYKTKAPANWCPSCKTVLANEQVVEGKCERCDTVVVKKDIEQWLFKITKFADRLLKDLKDLDWPEKTKLMQRNWIGESKGAELEFGIVDSEEKIKVFTTRPDTLFGVTYAVLAPEHALVEGLKEKITNWKEVEKYREKSKNRSEQDRLDETKEKTGVELKGVRAVNPANQERISIWIADYVLATYGTGAIMAVPAHDERDFEFAKKFDLPVKQVIIEEEVSNNKSALLESPFLESGVITNSTKFNGTQSEEAKQAITKFVGGKFVTRYRLRDWLISRQRYWGTPIPIVYCKECGMLPVLEKELPIALPPLKDFKPAEDGRSPLARNKKFLKTKCPQCSGPAERETDTMDTFVDSSWYFLRYLDPKNSKKAFDKEKAKKWLPVDMYVGGAEHTVLHLLYARFFTKFFFDEGMIEFEEPFTALRHQGTILGPDGQKMSKSKGNVVDPDGLVAEFGADTVRLYLCFMSEYSQGGPWNPKGILGVARFLERIWKAKEKVSKKDSNEITPLLHKTIKKVTDDIQNFKFNTAVSSLMILLNELEKQESIGKDTFETFLKLLAPFAPFMTEELWYELGNTKLTSTKLGGSIHIAKWPSYNPKFLEEGEFDLVIQVNGKVRSKIKAEKGITEDEAKNLALADEKVKTALGGKSVKKVIYIKDRLLSLVV